VFDVRQAAELIARERITALLGAPPIFRALLDDPQVDRSSLSSLRVAGPGAMGATPELYRRLRAELGIHHFAPGYGLTEATAIVTRCYWFDDFETVATTSGRAVPGVEVRVLGHYGAAAPDGTGGERLVR